ncbi:MAG: bifunctional oligoribonuclease/PAP phosphatase NrnA [Eubacteriales bacterium]|nr:bifunctional oligoribonuclease/PAP phosphatase NrnA [Eubacteriales bacterium]
MVKKMLNNILQGVHTVAIGGHERPDGDCVGSCMGLYQYMKDNYPDISVDVYLEAIPEKFLFIGGTEDIRSEIPEAVRYDLFICLDCGDEERLGFSAPLFRAAGRTYCVDHHVSNQSFADENYIVPDASSTSELIYHLLDKDKITKEVAESLYIGIAHDTGVFQYSCASPATFRVAAELLEKGIDAPSLIDVTYYEKTYAQNQVLGRALLESIVFMDGKCIAASMKKSQMEFYGVTPKDLDGIVAQLRVTKGVEVAIFAYELAVDLYKVSLRSKKYVDVSKIAKYFGGGGHMRAAGCTMPGTIYDVLNNLSGRIAMQFTEE